MLCLCLMLTYIYKCVYRTFYNQFCYCTCYVNGDVTVHLISTFIFLLHALETMPVVLPGLVCIVAWISPRKPKVKVSCRGLIGSV